MFRPLQVSRYLTATNCEFKNQEFGLVLFRQVASVAPTVREGDKRVENKLGRGSFQKPDGTEYVVIASLSGEFLDTHANQSRTALEVSEDEMLAIVDAACDAILDTEIEQHEKIKSTQRDDVIQLLSRHPLLRYGLSGTTVFDYVRSKPNNWRQENFVSDLAIQRLREERRWTTYVQNTIADRIFSNKEKANFCKGSPTRTETRSQNISFTGRLSSRLPISSAAPVTTA